MKLLIAAAALLLLNSCKSPSVKERIDVKKNPGQCFQYPRVVDSLDLTDLYDSARWFIYTCQCDMPYLPKADTVRTRTFGELGLEFNCALYTDDTVDIEFYFMDNGRRVLAGTTRDTMEFASGVRFDLAKRKKIAILSHNNYSYQTHGDKSRYDNPLQPEVISYIKENWSKIDNCFRELAEKKGIKK